MMRSAGLPPDSTKPYCCIMRMFVVLHIKWLDVQLGLATRSKFVASICSNQGMPQRHQR